MCMGSSPKMPEVPAAKPIPEPPKAASANPQLARKAAEDEERRNKGQKSTILTSGLGLGTEAQTQKATLLGQ